MQLEGVPFLYLDESEILTIPLTVPRKGIYVVDALAFTRRLLTYNEQMTGIYAIDSGKKTPTEPVQKLGSALLSKLFPVNFLPQNDLYVEFTGPPSDISSNPVSNTDAQAARFRFRSEVALQFATQQMSKSGKYGFTFTTRPVSSKERDDIFACIPASCTPVFTESVRNITVLAGRLRINNM